MGLTIKWNKRAVHQLDEAIDYLEKEALLHSEKVKKEILFKIDSLLHHPESHSLDKYKTENDGSFRAFEVHHYRIAYRYKKNEIRIIRIRHTKMNPLNYWLFLLLIFLY